MYRKYIRFLADWKENRSKKALLVTGARQIGKTYLVREFGKTYENFVEINFITEPEAVEIFSGNLNADTIVMNLTAYIGRALPPGKTLVFLDEIQECPQARTAIKFLVEDGRFDYIESGSLLGVYYKHVQSYPVGYESILQMYPMDFEEFCIANGVQENVLSYLKDCFEKKQPVTSSIHRTMMELFRYYVIVGGMPEAVRIFIDSHDMGQVAAVQKDILRLYRQDIGRYALEGKTKITDIFDRIPSQLDDKNRRFQMASIKTTARLRDYEDAFVWLRDAGVALPCYNLREPKAPLKINEQARLFKLFQNDSGLLCAAGLENVQFPILQGDLSVNMGSILENVFAVQLVSNGFELRYLNKRNVGELDFVIQKGTRIIPLEIKSGKDYHLHAALDHALNVQEWALAEGIVFGACNVETEGKVHYLPWYMIMFLVQERLPAHFTAAPDLSALAAFGAGEGGDAAPCVE